MRVKLEHPLRTQSGTDFENGWTYYSLKEDTICIKGLYVDRRITEHNRVCGIKIRRSNELYRSIDEDFIKDLKRYADAYNKQLLPEKKCYVNFYNIFVKALCNGRVSLWELESMELFVSIYGNTLESWISNGLLPQVKGKFSGYECLVERRNVEVEQPTRIILHKGEKCRIRLEGVDIVVTRVAGGLRSEE